jgi:hypothetical protein
MYSPTNFVFTKRGPVKPGWLAIAAVFYCANLALLFIWPPYANFWAAWGTQIASNNVYPWMWATFGECLRLMFIMFLAFIVYKVWPESQPNPELNPEPNPEQTTNRFVQMIAAAFPLGRDTYDDSLQALEGMAGRARVQMIAARARRIPYHLTVEQVDDLIGPLSGRNKVDAIRILAPHLARGSSKMDLLDGLAGNDRLEAAKYLD